MATLQVRSGSPDGYVYKGDSSDYDTTQNAAIGEFAIITGSYATIGQQFNFEVAGRYMVTRTVLQFDTSSLGTLIGITSATLAFKVSNIGSPPAQDFNITMVDGTDAEDVLEVADYGELLIATVSGGSTVFTDPWVADSEKTITFNATGLTWINKTGLTKLCLRSDRDITPTQPTASGERIFIHQGGKSTEALRPLLTIEYVPPLITQGDATPLFFEKRQTTLGINERGIDLELGA